MAHRAGTGPRRRALRVVAALTALGALTGCGSSPSSSDTAPTTVLDDDAITVASFDFPESELLAEIYGQALEAGGFAVERLLRAGPRELVEPALARGLVELVPEYAGTAVAFLSGGAVDGAADPKANHRALEEVLAGREVVALDAAEAEDRNTLAVTAATADRLGLRDVSDLVREAPRLRLGGPPECPSRPLCLPGYEDTYGLRFRSFVPLDAGGPLTIEALGAGLVDVALLFTTHPAVERDLVALADDRGLQPAENVTPVLHREVLRRWGRKPADLIDRVSERLTTPALRALNAEVVTAGLSPTEVAGGWLLRLGLA